METLLAFSNKYRYKLAGFATDHTLIKDDKLVEKDDTEVRQVRLCYAWCATTTDQWIDHKVIRTSIVHVHGL